MFGVINYHQILLSPGSASAQYEVANMFFKGTVIAKDKAIAAALYRKAMEMGSSDARARLAMMYYHGDGEICLQLWPVI